MSTCFACGHELMENISPSKPFQLVGCVKCLNVSQIRWLDEGSAVEPILDFSPLENLAEEGSVMAGVLSVVPESIEQLPVLAEIPQRVVATIHDPIASIQDIVVIIEEDAVLSTKILSLANRAFFATVTDITDLTTACSRLGMRQLANVATTMSAVNQYKSSNPDARKLMQKLWQHAVATAHCSETIATKLKLNTTAAFIAGLIHDIGKVVLMDAITMKYGGNVGRLNQSPALLAKAINPFAPTVGLHVIQHWNLAKELTFSTLYAQNPGSLSGDVPRDLSYCISPASDLAESKGFGILEPDSVNFEGHPSLSFFDIDAAQFEEISAGLDELLDSVMTVFGDVG